MIDFRPVLHTLAWVKRHVLNEHRVPETKVIASFIKPTDVVLDIGAHSGAWTVPLSKMVPQGKVFAFEALPYYARVLKATLRVLRIKNVDVINRPILDENRSVEMVWLDPKGSRLTGLTHVKASGESAKDTVSVESMVLDQHISVFGGPIRFIKMDIEGAELLALKGAIQLINTHKPMMFIELNESHCLRYGHKVIDVFHFFGGLDYEGCLRSEDGVWSGIDASSYSGSGDVWFLPVDQARTLKK